MSPWIDIGLVVCCVAAVAASWPYMKNLALLLEQMEGECIARQIAEDRDWQADREDYNIHKSL
jgi:hypothetical protein